MPHNETSELDGHGVELVLGNKQLLSVFFVVIILLGIFFAMGYAVGRNSTPVDSARRSDQPYERTNAPSAVPSTGAKRESHPVVVEQQQPAQTSAAETQPAQPAAQPAPTPAAPAKEAPVAAAPKPIELPAVTVTQPQVGQMYLQVLAVAKPEAEVLAEVLGKKGFRAMVAPGPNDKIFRVLVGPAKDVNEAGKLKTDLEAAGFKPFLKKY